jgi:hypothetical protein
MDLTNVCGIFHPTALDYTFFSNIHGTLFRIYHASPQISLTSLRSVKSYQVSFLSIRNESRNQQGKF